MTRRWTRPWFRRVASRAAGVLAAVWALSLFTRIDRTTVLPGPVIPGGTLNGRVQPSAQLPDTVRVGTFGDGALKFREGTRELLTLKRFLKIERGGVAWELRFQLPSRENIEWRWRLEDPQVAAGMPAWGVALLGQPQIGAAFPLWIPVAAAAVPAALLWLPRRRREGLCRGCRYDLSGLPAGIRCPECGAAPVVPKP